MKNFILNNDKFLDTEYIISYSKLGNMAHFFFILSILLYPITLANHTLYVIPQVLMLGISVANLNKRLYFADYTAFFCGIIAFSIPIVVELTAQSTNFELASKLFVNVVSIIVIAGDERIKFSTKTLRHIRYILVIWFVVIVLLYLSQGITSLASLAVVLDSGSNIDSSKLYNFAEPLHETFLTKNISAMFVVSVFSFYIYVAYRLDKKVSFLEFILFFVVSTAFLSRQSILTIITLYGFYRFVIAGYANKVIVITMSAALGMLFFTTFFNLQNTNDGANQRLDLWRYFFNHFQDFFYLGNGVDQLNTILRANLDIDNFHMFFMNQIGAYGIFHFIAFSLFLIFIYNHVGDKKGRVFLVVGYFLNVCFQTYGYEYGNLFLFMVMYPLIDHRPERSWIRIPKITFRR
ncbi:hypothetical protein [Serratia sp. M24T3]|uniref:hypothetical protein n=1 Tax=Serratia sp. M24T3 TaxID=932213 RepID=UPI00025B955B|nr:hypothetical protein [Serratia sp. M24T3]EIC86649.1 hypothetical protein SPM24T3_01170 [Serratia sp. M24T3]